MTPSVRIPVVRYMLLCEDWCVNPSKPRRVNINRLISTIRAPAFPAVWPEFCVFFVLTDGSGTGEGTIVCQDDQGENKFAIGPRPISFENPLELVAVPFRIRNSRFPQPGVYSIQFYYNAVLVGEQPLQVR